MQLKEIMTKDVEVLHPEIPIQEAAEMMKELDIGSLPICDGRRLLGIVTDRDIAIRAVAEGQDPRSTQVGDIMSPGVVYCFEDQEVSEAARVMQDEQIRRLPILNRDKELVGIISLGDLAVATGRKRMSGEALTEISRPSEPDR